MTRAASVLLRVLGLALVLVGLMGFALVGDGGSWTARAELPAGRTALLVEPAVASVLGPRVTLRVQPSAASDGAVPLFLGRGRSDDLSTLAQDPGVSRVVGLVSSRVLDVRQGPGPVPKLSSAATPTASSGSVTVRPAVASLDLWQQQVRGPQARELTWRPTPGARSILVATEDGSPLPALDVAVVWTDGRWTWFPVLALVAGLCLMLGGFLLAGPPLGQIVGAVATWPRRIRSSRRDRSSAETPEQSSGAQSLTAPGTVSPPSEKQKVAAPAGQPVSEAVPSSAAIDHEAASQHVASQHVAGPQAAAQQAARGRRRKPTTWQRAQAKVRGRGEGSR